MREIKFRAWWKEAKLMADVEMWRESDVVISVPVISSIPGQTHERQLLEEDQYNLMQYTGLKDKNGKEIYEGDVVRQTFLKTETGQVTIEATRGVIVGSSPIWPHDCEVIGNIYENPDLLT